MLTDIGVNLMSSSFDKDRGEVIVRAAAAGVTTLIITGSSIAGSEEAVSLINDNAHIGAGVRLFSTAGVHPHDAKDWNSAAAARLKELAVKAVAAATVVAVGECGLDYNRNFSPQEAQRKCFEDQLALAAELGKPVFLHERDAEHHSDAFNDFCAILKQYRPNLPGAVVHCFTGEMKELEAYLALDCYIGITGWVCDERRGAHLLPLLRHIPADRLLLETDAPYLLPRNLPKAVKGKSGRNEPCFLPHIAAFVADILGKTPEQLAAETSANAACLFG